jgi:tetratricopeptide (TPR) repeat protein
MVAKMKFVQKPWHRCIAALFGLAALLVVYGPALNGGFVWDDDAWTSKLEPLFSANGGLGRIWANDPLLQQYYPLTATTFWLDWHLWHEWTLPYHLENVLLHAACAALLGMVLTRLKLPGAWLSAAVFAFHPVMVESVAWITERKNALSLALTLGSLLAYGNALGWWLDDKPVKPRSWWLALVLCLAALLAKITAFVLPPALLLIAWWKRGRLSWRQDGRPALPFFIIAFGLGVLVWWLETNHVGAEGREFEATLAQRTLNAGRAAWFYPWKLLWPVDLCFIYPDWRMEPAAWWHWLFPISVPLALFAAWKAGRGLFIALLFYLGAIAPVLGFLNVYGALFSPVWDHWAYVPVIGLLVPICSWVAQKVRPFWCLLGVVFLAFLSWKQSALYRGKEELWLATIARNPNAWIALTNHGLALSVEGRLEEGATFLQRAIEVRPHYPKAYGNLGGILLRLGKHEEAIQAYQQALRQDPSLAALARKNIGGALLLLGRTQEAHEQLQASLVLNSADEEIRPVPENEAAMAAGRFIATLDRDPKNLEAAHGLADLYLQQNRAREALPHLDEILRQQPGHILARHNRAIASFQLGQYAEARRLYEEVLTRDPSQIGTMNNLAWLLATCPDETVRDGPKALELIQNALRQVGGRHAILERTQAAALAEGARFAEAITIAEAAFQLAAQSGNKALADSLRDQITLYRSQQPVREGASAIR